LLSECIPLCLLYFFDCEIMVYSFGFRTRVSPLNEKEKCKMSYALFCITFLWNGSMYYRCANYWSPITNADLSDFKLFILPSPAPNIYICSMLAICFSWLAMILIAITSVCWEAARSQIVLPGFWPEEFVHNHLTIPYNSLMRRCGVGHHLSLTYRVPKTSSYLED
jgi:hypothetical protein